MSTEEMVGDRLAKLIKPVPVVQWAALVGVGCTELAEVIGAGAWLIWMAALISEYAARMTGIATAAAATISA
jgi:hypothetical protein